MGNIDLTGGLDASLDYPLARRPENPQMRDSVSMWISDDQGRFGLPRVCIEAVAEIWENRGIQANIGFPDGRILNGAGGYAPTHPAADQPRHEIIDAGPLAFRVIEPLRRWTMRFDGKATDTTVQRQIGNDPGGPEKRVRVEIEAVMAVPPWIAGEQAVAAGDTSTASAIGAIGGHRHEQLFRCSGFLEIEGEDRMPFTGPGLRIRRTGVRNVGDFPGHCWQSALFPSGKAFGLTAFPPRSDGTSAYNEAFVWDGARKRYAKVIEAPWLNRLHLNGANADVVLETSDGERIRISGTVRESAFFDQGTPLFGDWSYDGGVGLPFHQGGVLYEWDGETTYGMIERSLPKHRIQP
ncbi:hypothetical protein GGQ88_002239 [Novosphingobium hassiacum]|uniref:6-phosphofructokinase n=1 Tax=Novosphingobium hassiacum TaxID=173676 RepID=A0A7W6A0F1_9SPHN|nr:hypothetical protein [Novosphingobium hassiacum]MBB3860970.1 hypothetical protein [Novosphingobium hassiacum]